MSFSEKNKKKNVYARYEKKRLWIILEDILIDDFTIVLYYKTSFKFIKFISAAK